MSDQPTPENPESLNAAGELDQAIRELGRALWSAVEPPVRRLADRLSR